MESDKPFDIKKILARPVDPITGRICQPGEERPEFRLIHLTNPEGKNLHSIDILEGDARHSFLSNDLVLVQIFPDQGTFSLVRTSTGSQRFKREVFKLDQISYHLIYK